MVAKDTGAPIRRHRLSAGRGPSPVGRGLGQSAAGRLASRSAGLDGKPVDPGRDRSRAGRIQLEPAHRVGQIERVARRRRGRPNRRAASRPNDATSVARISIGASWARISSTARPKPGRRQRGATAPVSTARGELDRAQGEQAPASARRNPGQRPEGGTCDAGTDPTWETARRSRCRSSPDQREARVAARLTLCCAAAESAPPAAAILHRDDRAVPGQRSARMTLQLLAVVVLAVVFDYINGFHDTANAIATSVATRALRPAVRDPHGGHLQLHRRVRRDGGRARPSAPASSTSQRRPRPSWSPRSSARSPGTSSRGGSGLPSSSSHALIGGLLGATIMAAGTGAAEVERHRRTRSSSRW